MHTLTGFQRDLLTVIAGHDKPSGQDIKSELESQVGDINHGRLYPNLDALVEANLVDKGEIDRRTNYYALSDAGREALVEYDEWRENYATPVSSPAF
ncbi:MULTISPECIES: PadR family transcriptional regulator [unclassified Haladaptatus]|uniref:PadR family transcriptional regulator n=1 Tax=unclassified Haladaptatus TaxID=2622732 RepID=UPI0023E7B13B|nr:MULTISPECIES: PadR family transcriptional regulator [unclassified Haladaptatus]